MTADQAAAAGAATGRLSLRTFLLALAGLLLVQAAWVLVVPPFRGLDEHDHAFKAAAVARGDWSAQHAASEGGWGELVVVPRTLVEAAGPVCEDLPYTKADNCVPGKSRGDGLVEVSSSASRYNPVFYFVVGTAARPFEGANALYAMRAAAALMCALLVAAGVAVTRSWSRTAWPGVTQLLALSPVFLYSTAVAAPNGIEIAGAFLLWSALLGLTRSAGGPGAIRTYLALACLGAVPLVTVRSLGPLWLALIVLCVLVTIPGRELAGLLRTRVVWIASAGVGAAALAGAVWTLGAGTNSLADSTHHFDRSLWVVVPVQMLLWVVQSVAAFPARDELAPAPVYALVMCAWWLLVALAWRAARGRQRLALIVVPVVTALVPVTVTLTTYSYAGTVWQGRYSYPLAMGLLLVSGWTLDARRNRSDADESQAEAARNQRVPGWWALGGAATVMALAEVLSLLDVLQDQRATSPLAGSAAWIDAPAPVIVAFAVAGVLLLGVAQHRATERRVERRSAAEPELAR